MFEQSPNYGWIPDIPDQRDYLYSAIKPKVRLPKEADLRKYCSTVPYEYLETLAADFWTIRKPAC